MLIRTLAFVLFLAAMYPICIAGFGVELVGVISALMLKDYPN